MAISSTTTGATIAVGASDSIANGVTVSNSGAVGSSPLVIGANSGATATLSNSGTITSVSGSSLTAIGASSADNIVIGNGGTIQSLGTGRGIHLDNTITVTNSGTIQAGSADTIKIDNNAIITNSGTITCAASDGEALDLDSSATVTNQASGFITATGTDDAIKLNSGTVTNYGTITTTSNDGIKPNSSSANVTVHNYGTITAGDKGVNSSITTGTLSVTNYSSGSITGTDTGIAGQTGTVVNYGLVKGLTDDGMDFDGSATITNYGTVTCTAAAGTTATGPDSADGVTMGGGSLTNTGTILSDHNGVYVVVSASAPTPTAAAAVTITNSGTITGTAGYGIRCFGTFDDAVTNSGVITSGLGIGVDLAAGNDTLTLTGGSIKGLLDGGAGTDALVINTGGQRFDLTGVAQNFETLTVTSGTLASNNFAISAATSTNVAAGAALIGGGTLTSGTVTINGSLEGGWTINGNVSLSTTSAYSSSPFSGLTVNGTVTLDGTLSLGSDSRLAVGQTITLVNNDGVDAVTGTFKQLAEGTEFISGNGKFTISYVGGTGNDVVLTVKAVIVDPGPPPVTTNTVGAISVAQYGDLNEQLSLGGAHDQVWGMGGNDSIQGNDGHDTLFGNVGSDSLTGGNGMDVLYGGKDADQLFGNQDDDLLFGNLGTDTLYGGQGADSLYGGRENDLLFGNVGKDFLSGDLGNDTLTGGDDADIFFFAAAGGADVVTDFNLTAGDRLNLGGQTYSIGSDANGTALLTLSGGGSILLSGHSASEIAASWFV